EGDSTSEGGAREEERRSVMFSWSASPALQKIFQGLEDQQQVIDQLKRYLEERLTPFQRHIAEQRRNTELSLKHLESRIKPLRQYIQGEGQNLERIVSHMHAGLREQFENFDQYLRRHKGLLEEAHQYIEEQPRPLRIYLEDQRQAIEMIYADLEERLDRFIQNLWEQQKILESLTDPQILSEYETLAEYLEERQKALERYSRSPEYRPQELFEELDEISDRYQKLDPTRNKLFGKVFEDTRIADEKLRAILPLPMAPSSADVESADVEEVSQDSLEVPLENR
ncbi:MAG: hypothetical protein ACE5G5_12760, partial [Candidatus Methylomirabilales bacterium]